MLGGPIGGPRSRRGPHLFGGKELRGGPGLPGHERRADRRSRRRARHSASTSSSQQLRDGKSIADVAKAQGKSLDGVRSAVKATAKARLDKAVKDGDLTQKQADRRLEGLDAMLTNLDAKRGLLPRRRRHLRGELPPVPPIRPGSMLPGEGVPELEPPPGVF